jgi:hypothetical protein
MLPRAVPLILLTVTGTLPVSTLLAQAQAPQASKLAPALVPSRANRRISPYRSAETSASAMGISEYRWGADSFTAKLADSGQMVRFSYRVIDAQKAKQLNDKKAEPYLIDQRARVKLVVPTMEKIGQLRQSSTPQAGKVYWMVFSNKGGHVKRGDRVSVMIGKFRVDELVVE